MIKNKTYVALKRMVRFFLNDEFQITRTYNHAFAKGLDLIHPQTFNEKLQFQKLYNRDPRIKGLADKLAVRNYVKNRVGEQILNDLLGVYSRPEDIDFDSLPSSFVIKCNHSWGTNIVCEDKSQLDISEVKNTLRSWMNDDHYKRHCEWVYKDIVPKISIERFLGNDVKDIKIFCFDGQPKYIEVDSDRSKGHLLDIYDLDWNRLDVRKGGNPNHPEKVRRPPYIEELLSASEKLSAGINFCRVDFLVNADEFYFCEITFYPGAGYSKFEPASYDTEFGNHLDVSGIQLPLRAKAKIIIIQVILYAVKLKRAVKLKLAS